MPAPRKPSIVYEVKGPRAIAVPVARCVCRDEDLSVHLAEDHFSDGFMAKLAAIPFGVPTDFLLILFLPPLLTWTWMLVPYADPDQPAEAQGLWVWWGVIDHTLLCHFAMAHLMTSVAGVRRDFYVNQKLNLWCVVTSILSMLAKMMGTRILHVFPIPMASLCACTFCGMNLPLLLLCIPADQRANQHFRKRALCAVASVLAIVCLFGLAFPMMNVAALKLPAKWQALIFLVYTMVDFGFDKVGDALSPHIGADAMPCLLFAGTMFYEFNMNVAFAGGFDPLVFLEGILLDLLKNAHEIYTLVRLEAERMNKEADIRLEKMALFPTAAPDHAMDFPFAEMAQAERVKKEADIRSLERVALFPTANPEDAMELDIAETEQAMPHDRPHELYVVGMMILRLFVQLLVSIHFLVSFAAARVIRPELNDLVCSLEDADFQFTAFMVAVNVALQSTLTGATIVFMHRYGFYPLHLLQGLLRLHRPAFLTTAICASTFFLSLQFSHGGNDLQFSFLWASDRHAKWKCGLQWTTKQG